ELVGDLQRFRGDPPPFTFSGGLVHRRGVLHAEVQTVVVAVGAGGQLVVARHRPQEARLLRLVSRGVAGRGGAFTHGRGQSRVRRERDAVLLDSGRVVKGNAPGGVDVQTVEDNVGRYTTGVSTGRCDQHVLTELGELLRGEREDGRLRAGGAVDPQRPALQ